MIKNSKRKLYIKDNPVSNKDFFFNFRVLMSIGLLIFLPVLSKFFGLNDTIVLTLCGVLDGSGNLYVCI